MLQRGTYISIILSFILVFFLVLMVRITLPYHSLETDVAFLMIKQWVIDNPVWRLAFFVHVFTAIFLLLAGFTQFYNPFNPRFSKVHRVMGKMYVVILVFLAGPSGLVMSIYANGGWSSKIAFTLLSSVWMYVTVRAYQEARNKDFSAHGAFMVRSYALTLSALTLRAWKFGIVILLHPHPMDAYRTVAWLGWIPNLLLAEYLIRNGIVKRIMRG